eukprot:1319390-Amphidinium_carterae.1
MALPVLCSGLIVCQSLLDPQVVRDDLDRDCHILLINRAGDMDCWCLVAHSCSLIEIISNELCRVRLGLVSLARGLRS